MSEYKLCTHTYDSGRTCKSAAAKGREFCGYHLRYRGRLMRRARARSRNELFNLILPPLDSLCSIQSALSQVAEALAADMIDPRRAQGLLKALRFAKENLRDSLKDNVDWHDTPYLSEDQSPYDNFESDYGLPAGIDLNLHPDVAFPPPPESTFSDLSSRAEVAAATGVEGPAVLPGSPESMGAPNVASTLSPMPTSGYCSEHGYDCPDLVIRADHPVTPEAVEIVEISQTQGPDAAARRSGQLERNRRLRQLRHDRKRYAAIALEKNMRLAAEKLAEQKLAAAKKPPVSIAADVPESPSEEVKNTA